LAEDADEDLSVRFIGRQTSREGDRKVKSPSVKRSRRSASTPPGEIFERAYAYVAEHY
jgi:hypothetical protein